LLGLLLKSPIGLLIGHALSGGIGGIGLLKSAWKSASGQIREVNLRSLKAAAAAYKSFPKYSIIDGLSTNAGSQLPILLIAAWSSGPEAGYLLLATKIIAAPVTMVSGAASQVFLTTAPEKMREGRLPEFAASVSRGLILLMSIPLIIFGSVAAPLIETLFGNEWARTGSIVLWLIPWYSMRLLSAPLSMVMNVKGRQKAIMHMKVWALIFRVGAVVLAYNFLRDRMVEVLAVASFMVYLFFGIVFLREAGVTLRSFLFGPVRGS
jgi:O-antigen/teichoic acid export membrane protein